MHLYSVDYQNCFVHGVNQSLVPACSGAQRRKGSGADLEPSASAEPKQKQGWFSRGLFNKNSKGKGDKADSDDDMRSVSSFSTTASLVRAYALLLIAPAYHLRINNCFQPSTVFNLLLPSSSPTLPGVAT